MAQNLNLIEISVLGNIILDSSSDTMLTAIQRLTVADFSDERNRAIFQAMLILNQNNIKPDVPNLIDKLKDSAIFSDNRIEDYINDIIDNTSTVVNVEVYMDNIKDKSLLNRFLITIKNIYDRGLNESLNDIGAFISESEKQINEISNQRRITEAKRLSQISPSLVGKWVKQSEEFRNRKIQPNGIVGLETGYAKLDYLTKGWQKGNLILIGARPSVGKTAFTLNLLYNVAKNGHPVIFFSLEMSSEAIEMRLLELSSNLTRNEITSLDFQKDSTAQQIHVRARSQEENGIIDRLQKGLNHLGTLPFYIDENPGSTINDIAARCKKLINGQNIKAELIAIDYLGLITSNKKNANRNEQVADISRSLKLLSRELDIPIIALSQLSRDSAKRGVDHEPQLTDLRDSGNLEQDADMVFFLHRPEYYNDQNDEDEKPVEEDSNPFSTTYFFLKKNRDGMTGKMTFSFDKEHCRFLAISDDQ